MHQRGFTPTSVVWIVLLVGVLFMVGKTVTPPPPGPPAPPPKPTSATPGSNKVSMDTMKEHMMDMQRQKMKTAKSMPKAMKPKVLAPNGKPFDPNSIEVTNDYFKEYQEGKVGESDLAKRVAAAKAEQAEQMKAAKAAAAAAKKSGGDAAAGSASPGN